MGITREEPLVHVAYLYDGSVEGLLSAIFLSYARHEQPEDIVEERLYQPRLLQSAIVVDTDLEHARRVRKGISRQAGERAFATLVRAVLSDAPGKGATALRFVRYAMDAGPGRNRRHSILSDLANPAVGDLVALGNYVAGEAERMRQFIRFSRRENGIWYARCNPNASVVPLVMPHFVARFNIQPFLIYDEVHELAGAYDGRNWQLMRGTADLVPAQADGDAYMEALWQCFYDAVSIDARYNPELRRHFMPARLWKNLPEMLPHAQGLRAK